MKQTYHYVVGTGGVGKGILFKLFGSHDLGRNESRLGILTADTDYCKLHIILTYVSAFLNQAMPIYAISRVGDDPVGKELLTQMAHSNINTDFMGVSKNKSTLFSVCYQFPGGEGGNISSANGANDSVCESDIQAFFNAAELNGKGMVLAAAEVPMEVRLSLLREGRKRNCYNVASVLSDEVSAFYAGGGFELTDLLAVNEDEAAAIAAFAATDTGADIAMTCYHYVQGINPEITLAVTFGKNGSRIYSGGIMQERSALSIEAVNTAGAGDCFLGTLMACILMDIPLIACESDAGLLSCAQDFAGIAAAMKVQCADTIDFSINRESLFSFAKSHGLQFSAKAEALFSSACVQT